MAGWVISELFRDEQQLCLHFKWTLLQYMRQLIETYYNWNICMKISSEQLQRKHKLSLSSYTALIFHHFQHAGRTINQPFKLHWLSSRVECTNHCLAGHCDKAPAVKFKKENFAGDNQGQRSLIEVSGNLCWSWTKTQKDHTVARPLNLFNQSCIQGQDQQWVLCYAMASTISLLYP